LSPPEIFVLGIMWTFFAANLILWEQANERLFAFDEIGHFFNSVAVSHIISHPWVLPHFSEYLAEFSAEHAAFFTFQLYPPFVYIITALVYFVWPPSLPLAASSNAIFLLVLEVSTYAMARDLFGKSAGFAAALLVCVYPILVGVSRVYLLEFALAGTVSTTCYLLTKEQALVSRRSALLLATSLLIGLLTLESFPLYVAGPCAFVFFKNYRNKAALKNTFLVTSIVSIGLLYYLIKPGGILAYSLYLALPKQRGLEYIPPITALIRELEIMLVNGMGFPLSLLFILGITLVAVSSRHRLFLIIGMLTPITLLALFEPYIFATEYVAPILPLVAVTSSALFKRRPHHLHMAGVAMLAFLALSQYGSITYNVPALSSFHVTAEPTAPGITEPPSTDDWKIPQIVTDLKHDAAQRHLVRPFIVVLAENVYFEQTLFVYYAYLENFNLAVKDNGYLSERVGINSVCTSDYMVDRSHINLTAKPLSGPDANIAGVSRFVESHLEYFELIETYQLPDESVASLYHRTLSCTNEALTSNQSSLWSSVVRVSSPVMSRSLTMRKTLQVLVSL
jgi:uncharacterized membrane protein (Fun14 family)